MRILTDVDGDNELFLLECSYFFRPSQKKLQRNSFSKTLKAVISAVPRYDY